MYEKNFINASQNADTFIRESTNMWFQATREALKMQRSLVDATMDSFEKVAKDQANIMQNTANMFDLYGNQNSKSK